MPNKMKMTFMADMFERFFCHVCGQDSGQSRVESGPHSWLIQLDQDLLDTIIAIYPEWFKEYNQKRGAMSEGSGGASNAPQSLPSAPSSAPVAAEVDESPLQKTMDKNKESLKVKLMMRRPINQLVAQGIMPSLKTPPAFHEQRQKLERAKMGDLLKAKIQQRPDREELVRQHILEADVTHVDPSLADRQRMLKKARLADSLNDQLSHRPGPLELIKKNILHTEEPIERAVKEGVIPFKATSEGQLRKPQHPDHYITFEDDSQSSEGGGSPSDTPASFASNSLPTLDNIASSVTQSKSKESSRGRDVLETAAANAGIVNVAVTIPTNAVVVTSPILQQIPNDKSQTLQTFAELCSSVVSPLSLGSSTSSLSPLSSIASPPTPLTPRPTPLSTSSSSSSSSSAAPGKADKNRKKSKTKTQPKTRTIKFHEYKGPPNAQKNTPSSASSTETSYELLLQQQQLFLQWQLEWQHKYPQIILPAAQKPSNDNLQNTISSITNAPGNAATAFLVTQSPRAPTPVVQAAQTNSKSPSSPPQPSTEPQVAATQSAFCSGGANAATLRVLTKLEDMKVSDLKMELKKRNLPVSGPKPQLIERLKPFAQAGENGGSQNGESNGSANAGRTATGENPGSVASEMEVAVSPSNVVDEEDGHFSPNAKTSTPPPASPAPSAMDTTEATPPTSPSNGDTIIQQQQRKIEELQRELQKSQQQLQQIRQGKEPTAALKSSTPITVSSSAIPVKALLQNGIIRIDSKSQQKLLLQQHLQNKIQQQQLQVQLQQLQQQQNEAVNAKANLAAFINQQQAQQQLNSLLQAAANNNNNNNNDNVTSNNLKNKLTGRRSIVLGQHQAAIVLNHLVKKNGGILGHQRTSSLPTFLGALVENVGDKEKKKRAGSEEQQTFVVAKPPPGYKEATSGKEDEEEEEKKNVKSQIVDDVLEILIKNGELPPSAANDPATPTTPGRSCDPEKGLVYPPAPPPPPPPPPLPHPSFSVALPDTFAADSPFALTSQTADPPTYTLTEAYVTSSERENIPPVNNITFSISNPTYDNNKNFSSGYLDVMSTDNADFDMNNANDQNFHSSTLDYILSSNDNLLSSSDNMLPTEYANGDINLKELGLDLETLDTMDFSQLDCKMDTSESEMDTGHSDALATSPGTLPNNTTTTTTSHNNNNNNNNNNTTITTATNKADQLINNNPELVKPEMIEPMDMDDNWLDSLMPLSDTHSTPLSSSSNGYDYENSYDSMLGTGQDPFELFDIHDSDFKLPSSSLSWDKVDFAT